MDALTVSALGMFTKLLPLAAVFAALAIAVKRGSIWSALKRARRESEVNIGLVIMNYVILAAFFGSAMAWWSNAMAVSADLARFWTGSAPIFTLAVTLLVGELVIYWRHRIEHLPFLWPMHAVHHSDQTMTWLALLRKHPLAYVLALFADVAPLLLLGLPIWAIAVCAIARTWWGHFIHADVPWTLGVAGKWLISPAAHRLHHIDNLELCGSNYGGMLTIWDRVFGTYVDPAPYVNCRTGVDGGSRGLLGEIARPFAIWFRPRQGDQAPERASQP
ncbi:sterol desaturase family protein [Altererythrobacter sp.]|nr:sterol desaturase family protein [Altererythrobacter sp.]